MAEETQVQSTPEGGETTVAQAGLEEQLEQARKQAAECKDNWMRAAADLQNYRRRVERERGELAEWANSQLILRLLEVLDGFDSAFAVIPDKYRSEPWVEGIRLVEQKLRTILNQERVRPIDAVGKPFDPNFHEAMWEEQSPEHEEGQVIGEFQRGYLLGERVLRPSRVKVATGGPNQKGGTTASGGTAKESGS